MASALASAASVSFELGDHFGQGLAADGLNFVSTGLKLIQRLRRSGLEDFCRCG